MKKTSKRTLTPKLRFPEFRGKGEWETKQIGNVCDVLQGYGFPVDLQGKLKGDYPFCKVSDISKAVNERGGMLREAANFVDYEVVEKLRARPIPIGTTVFAKIGEALRLNRRAITTVECLIDNNAVGLKAKSKSTPDYFIFSLLHLIDLNKHCGGAVPSVNKSTLEKIEIPIPTPKEQHRIADCLSSLDDLISAEARALDALKAHKKGLMQQLFPREGETTPRLRFPEFRGKGEWESKKLKKVAPLQRGFDLPASEICDGQVPIVYSNGIRGKHATGMATGPGLVTGRSGTIGKLHYIESGEYWPHNTALWVTDFCGNVPKFIYYLYDAIGLERFSSGSGVPTLNRNDVHAFLASIPKKIQEQQTIADCLSSLDTQIEAQTAKIEVLKQHKRGLMQQLFPVAEGA